MAKTPNIELTKPEENDSIELSVINDNYDIIDTAIGELINECEGKAPTSDLTAHIGNADIHVTADDKSSWDGAVEQAASNTAAIATLSGKLTTNGIIKVRAYHASDLNYYFRFAEFDAIDYNSATDIIFDVDTLPSDVNRLYARVSVSLKYTSGVFDRAFLSVVANNGISADKIIVTYNNDTGKASLWVKNDISYYTYLVSVAAITKDANLDYSNWTFADVSSGQATLPADETAVTATDVSLLARITALEGGT